MKQQNTSDKQEQQSVDQIENPSVQQKSDLKPRESDEKNNNTEIDKFTSKPFSRWLPHIIQASLALITLGTLFVMYIQLKAFRDQTEILKTQMINDTRAWVTVEKAYHNPFREGERVAARVVFVNSGNSPAMNVAAQTEMELRSNEVPTPMPLRQTNQLRSKSVMGPQAHHTADVFSTAPLSKQHTNAVTKKGKRLYVWGRIEYDDIFNQHRTTEFCMRSQINSKKFEACENNNTVK